MHYALSSQTISKANNICVSFSKIIFEYRSKGLMFIAYFIYNSIKKIFLMNILGIWDILHSKHN